MTAALVRQSIHEGLKQRAAARDERGETFGMFTLLVTGSARQTNADLVWNPLFWFLSRHEQMIVRHLPAAADHGVDAFVEAWCHLQDEVFNADPNGRLVLEQTVDTVGELVDPTVSACAAFPQGRRRGQTWEVMARAWSQGMPVLCFSSSHVGRFHELTEHEGLDLAKRCLGWGS